MGETTLVTVATTPPEEATPVPTTDATTAATLELAAAAGAATEAAREAQSDAALATATASVAISEVEGLRRDLLSAQSQLAEAQSQLRAATEEQEEPDGAVVHVEPVPAPPVEKEAAPLKGPGMFAKLFL